MGLRPGLEAGAEAGPQFLDRAAVEVGAVGRTGPHVGDRVQRVGADQPFDPVGVLRGEILHEVAAERGAEHGCLRDAAPVHHPGQVFGPFFHAAGRGIGDRHDAGAILQRLDLLPEDVGAAKRAGDQDQRGAGFAGVDHAPFPSRYRLAAFRIRLREAVPVGDQTIGHWNGFSMRGQ